MNAIHRRPQNPALPPINRLSPNQQLLIFAMRHWAAGPTRITDVAQNLFSLFGIYYIEAALETFETMMNAITDTVINGVDLHPLGCDTVSSSELTVLKIISAFQANEWKTAQTFARQLSGPENVSEILSAASFIAETLEARRILFTLRQYQPLALMTVAGRG